MSLTNKKIQLIFKNKSMSHLLGAYQSNFKGSGLIYKESRPYVSGDPYHRIDWHTSAKKQELFLKEFEEERMLRILVVIQLGASTRFSTQRPMKLDMYDQLATLVGALALQQGDQVSFYGVSAESHFFLPLSDRAYALENMSHHLKNQQLTAQISIDEVIEQLNALRIRHHLVVWISDQLIEHTSPKLTAFAKMNDVLYMHIFDPFEQDGNPQHFQTNGVQLQQKQTSAFLTHQGQKEYAKHFAQKLAQSHTLFASHNITSSDMSTQEDISLAVARLFHKHAYKKGK